MRYLMMVMLTGESATWFESRKMDSPADYSTMVEFDKELAAAGALLSGNGLYPTASGARVEFKGADKPLVTDGPFVESKEVLGGYWILQVNSREEALAWARRAPMGTGSSILVRQIMDLADYSPEQQQAAGFAREME